MAPCYRLEVEQVGLGLTVGRCRQADRGMRDTLGHLVDTRPVDTADTWRGLELGLARKTDVETDPSTERQGQ